MLNQGITRVQRYPHFKSGIGLREKGQHPRAVCNIARVDNPQQVATLFHCSQNKFPAGFVPSVFIVKCHIDNAHS